MGVPADERETVGQRIKRLRKERGLSQIVLAEQTGVTDAWISQVETDKSTPSAELLNKIASVMKIPIRELLQDEEADLELTTRIKLVEVLLETNQPDEAETILIGLLDHPQLSEADSIKLTVHHAECKHQQKKYDEALDMLLPLVQRLETANYHDAHVLAWMHNQMGKAFFKKLDFTRAFYRFQKAYDLIGRFAQFDSLAAKISYNVGITMRRMGRPKDALAYLEHASAYADQNNDLVVMAWTFFDQGIAYKNIKDYTRATEYFEKAKSLFQSLNIMSFFNEVQLVMAYGITVEKDIGQALQQLQQCFEVFSRTNDFAGAVYVLAKMIDAHAKQQNSQEAESCLLEAEELIHLHSLQNDPETGEVYRIFASYCLNKGCLDSSIEYAHKASEVFGRIGLIRDQVDSLQVVADAYREAGNLGQAWQFERKCVQLLKQLQEGSALR